MTKSHIDLPKNEKIFCGIIYAIVDAFKLKVPLETGFAHYHSELIYTSL